MRCSRDIAAPLPSGAVAPQVLEYYDKLKPQCIAKPEPYAERKKRREKEIAGLKEVRHCAPFTRLNLSLFPVPSFFLPTRVAPSRRRWAHFL